jgi:hypothetical protein
MTQCLLHPLHSFTRVCYFTCAGCLRLVMMMMIRNVCVCKLFIRPTYRPIHTDLYRRTYKNILQMHPQLKSYHHHTTYMLQCVFHCTAPTQFYFALFARHDKNTHTRAHPPAPVQICREHTHVAFMTVIESVRRVIRFFFLAKLGCSGAYFNVQPWNDASMLCACLTRMG